MIFSAIGTAIAGALFSGSLLAANLISGALVGIAQLGVSYFNRPKKRKYSAVSGEVQFGADVAVATLYGIGKVAGHRVFYAKWGSGNKYNADVFALANGWCDGLEPYVYFYGERQNLVARPIIGNEASHWGIAGFGDLVSIRFYDGRPGQGPDQKLVNDTAPLGRKWKATSVGTGICYVVVERKYDSDKFSKGRPDFEWVLRGLREYDVRRDSTIAGGSGPQRIDDPSTWVFTLNPAIHRLNYQLGLKGRVSGRTLIGEGKSIGQLDLASYIASMNVSDTIRAGKPTYQCSLFVTGDDDHTQILKEFDDAMAGYGLNRRGLSGVIAGAPQVPVLTITDVDISAERDQDIAYRKSGFSLFNMMSGQFTSPESNWNPESLKSIKVNADIAADGRPRQTANDFLQVTDPDIAQYLLNIRYRQNRKGGSVTLPVGWRVGLRVLEGEWVNWNGRTWLIQEWQCDENFRFTLVLNETGGDVYSEAGIEPGPIVIPAPAPINPSLLSTVQNFNVEVGMIEGSQGFQVPALRFTWTPPEDPTITSVRFQYIADSVPTGGTIYEDSTPDPEKGEYITTKNVVSGMYYTSRATITTNPDRFKTYTQWKTTATFTGPMTVYLDGLVDEIRETVATDMEWIGSGLVDFIREAQLIADNQSDQDFANFQDKQTLRRELVSTADYVTSTVTAAYTEAITVAMGPGSALVQRLEVLEAEVIDLEAGITANASAITVVQASVTTLNEQLTAVSNSVTALNSTVGNFSADGRFRVTTEATPAGALARIGLSVAATGGGTTSQAAIFLDAIAGGTSKVSVVADQFSITDGTTNVQPFVFQNGIAYMETARIGTVKFWELSSFNNKLILRGGGDLADIRIFT